MVHKHVSLNLELQHPLSQQPPQAFEVLKISLFLGPKCCSNSPLKVLDLIVNFCKRQLIVSAIFLFCCTSDYS